MVERPDGLNWFEFSVLSGQLATQLDRAEGFAVPANFGNSDAEIAVVGARDMRRDRHDGGRARSGFVSVLKSVT